MVNYVFLKSRGSPYIVLAQLEGYFQLLDLADWDYAINISVDDFPLMSTGAIHQKLQVIIMNAYRIGRPRKELHSILGRQRNNKTLWDSFSPT